MYFSSSRAIRFVSIGIGGLANTGSPSTSFCDLPAVLIEKGGMDKGTLHFHSARQSTTPEGEAGDPPLNHCAPHTCVTVARCGSSEKKTRPDDFIVSKPSLLIIYKVS